MQSDLISAEQEKRKKVLSILEEWIAEIENSKPENIKLTKESLILSDE